MPTINGYTIQPSANLMSAYLRSANLRSAYLMNANLMSANLEGACLEGACLEGACLEGANLEGAILKSANLRSAILRSAYLEGASLEGADLEGACLDGAYLRSANLRSAYLMNANLMSANLMSANLEGACLPHYQRLPTHGAFTAWKKLNEDRIAELLVPADAERVSSLVGHKCRVSQATVIAITCLEGVTKYTDGMSLHDHTFSYRVGETVEPSLPFNRDIRIECASGIHCYPVRQEAIDHV